MTHPIQSAIQGYIEEQILENNASDLNNKTRLLELGILDSFSTLKLVSWIEDHFKVEIKSDNITAEHFADIENIADLVSHQI